MSISLEAGKFYKTHGGEIYACIFDKSKIHSYSTYAFTMLNVKTGDAHTFTREGRYMKDEPSNQRNIAEEITYYDKCIVETFERMRTGKLVEDPLMKELLDFASWMYKNEQEFKAAPVAMRNRSLRAKFWSWFGKFWNDRYRST